MNKKLVKEFFENETNRDIHLSEGKEPFVYVYDAKNKVFGNIKLEEYGNIGDLQSIKEDFVRIMGDAKETKEKNMLIRENAKGVLIFLENNGIHITYRKKWR